MTDDASPNKLAQVYKKESHEKVLGWCKKERKATIVSRESRLSNTHLRRWKVGHRLKAPAARHPLLPALAVDDFSSLSSP